MGSQRVKRDLETEQQQNISKMSLRFFLFTVIPLPKDFTPTWQVLPDFVHLLLFPLVYILELLIIFWFSSVNFSPSVVSDSATPWTTACQASLSITNSRSLPKLMSTESVMSSNYLILCRPLLLLPSIFPSIRVFSNESALRIRWPKYWNFSFSISPSIEHPGLTSL